MINPHCPVRGCRATRSHTEDPFVIEIVNEIASPQVFLKWVQVAISQLYCSVKDDDRSGRLVAYLTRIRQIEELYFKTLYILLLAEPLEVPHVVSGEMPNSFGDLYKRVNEEILLGRGLLMARGMYTWWGMDSALDVLNNGAHVGLKTLLFVKRKRSPTDRKGYLKHVKTYIQHIEHMRGLFAAGSKREAVRGSVVEMYKAMFDQPPES